MGATGCGLTLDLEPEPDGGTVQPSADLGTTERDAGPVVESCEEVADGAPCFLQVGGGGVCIGGACVVNECGDGYVGTLEQCDDGNDVDDDGCRSDCSIGCTRDDACPSTECALGRCSAEGLCLKEPADDGLGCTGGLCRAGECVPELCGNGVLDPDELCDDGNDARGDGCEPTCEPTCGSDLECDNGVECDGVEACITTGGGALCRAASVLPPSPECRYCDPATGRFELIDEDGDGYSPAAVDDLCGPADCDDDDASIYPGAAEVPGNGIDEDCNGVDDPLAPLRCLRDNDGDGFGGEPVSDIANDGACPMGTVQPGVRDCFDENGAVSPAQTAFFGEPWCDPAGGGCSFDYNCDGREERKFLERAECLFSTQTECEDAAQGWGGRTIPACGETGFWAECHWSPLLGCTRTLLPSSRRQVCR